MELSRRNPRIVRRLQNVHLAAMQKIHTESSKDSWSEPLTAKAAIRTIQSAARYFFEPGEFGRLVGQDGDSIRVKKALYRLAQEGLITLATRRPAGYLIVPAEQAHYGAPPVTWWIDDCLRRIESSYYVALLSAARYWGSSNFALQETQVMVACPRQPLTPGSLKVRFFSKGSVAETPTATVNAGVAPWRVSTREATLLDLIRHQADVGGIEYITRITKDFAPSLNQRALKQALDAMHQVPVAQRLGFILDHLRLTSLSQIVYAWLQSRRKNIQPLVLGDAERESSFEVNTKWSIRHDAQLRELVPTS